MASHNIKVGDRVRIVKLICAYDNYDIGDTAVVVALDEAETGFDGLTVKWDKPRYDDQVDEEARVTLVWPEEVVLEPAHA